MPTIAPSQARAAGTPAGGRLTRRGRDSSPPESTCAARWRVLCSPMGAPTPSHLLAPARRAARPSTAVARPAGASTSSARPSTRPPQPPRHPSATPRPARVIPCDLGSPWRISAHLCGRACTTGAASAAAAAARTSVTCWRKMRSCSTDGKNTLQELVCSSSKETYCASCACRASSGATGVIENGRLEEGSYNTS